MLDLHPLEMANSLLIHAPLAPAQGDRFQPTGFADIGAAVYSRPSPGGKVSMLLVESAQSMANRLEATCIGPDRVGCVLDGLPYVRATLSEKDGAEVIETSSLVEAHRLASPYILHSQLNGTPFSKSLSDQMKYSAKGPLNWLEIHRTLFKYDPNALIHGVFLSLIGDGRIRVPRALSAFIEAEAVEQAVSGGVKNSIVDPSGELRIAGREKEAGGIYSNVPYSRIEYTASSITVYFNLDLALVRGFGLAEHATHMLYALALLKIRRFLDSQLRLRTACALRLAGAVVVDAPKNFALPSEDELFPEVVKLIKQCAPDFGQPPITSLVGELKKAKKVDRAVAATAD